MVIITISNPPLSQQGTVIAMIIMIDRDAARISSVVKTFTPRFCCAVAETSEQLRNLVLSQEVFAVIADVEALESFQNGWETLLILIRGNAKLILLSDRYNSQEIQAMQAQGIFVLPQGADAVALENLLLPKRADELARIQSQTQKKNMSRLRDHLFSNLLDGHDLLPDVPRVMEFLGLQSPTHKYYLSLVFAYAPNGNRRPSQESWEIALRIQEIACSEISRIAQNRSCLRASDRLAMVLLMKEPGDPFRYDLEEILEVIRERIDKECGYRISVGVGLAGNTIEDLTCGYRQACDALDQGHFFGSSFVCFFCDLWERDSQRFQIPRAVKEQITQLLYSDNLPEIDKILETLFRQFHTLGLATKDNILALKIDIAVLLLDISDKLSVAAEKPKIYSRLINDCLQADNLPALEISIKQHLREIVSTSHAAQDKRAIKIVRSAQTAIMDLIGEPINVQLLAQRLHISPNYLSALFKSETGVRLTEYITNVKMQEAARLLRDTEKNIVEIAGILGYDNANYFSRLFKKHYGMNPSDYRLYNRESDED